MKDIDPYMTLIRRLTVLGSLHVLPCRVFGVFWHSGRVQGSGFSVQGLGFRV